MHAKTFLTCLLLCSVPGRLPASETYLAIPVQLTADAGWRVAEADFVADPHMGPPVLISTGQGSGQGSGQERNQEGAAASAHHMLVAPRRGADTGQRALTLENPVLRETRRITFNLADQVPTAEATAQIQADSLEKAYLTQLNGLLATLQHQGPHPFFQNWQRYLHEVAGDVPPRTLRRRRPDAGNMLSIFTGQTAIRETLQQQNIPGQFTDAADARTIPRSALPEIEVRAHDYEAMLAGQPGGHLPLADHAPLDRFFLYSPTPARLAALLQESGSFGHRLAGFAGNQGGVHQHLLPRHLQRLGITPERLQDWIARDLFSEIAIILPDFFLSEGTDFTVIVRLKQHTPDTFAQNIHDFNGNWRALDNDILAFGTRPAELDHIHHLAPDNQLGASAEFRYMLTQNPIDADTKVYLYFSDPFIRRLTGPEVKIGQFRRLAARGDLEMVAIADLQHRLLHGHPAEDLATLRQAGILPAPLFLQADDLSLVDGIAHHTHYGTLAEMTPLTGSALTHVTTGERNAYEAYHREYTRMWQQFFDPIAIALREADPRAPEIEVFILPLIESTFYTELRDFLAHTDHAAPMKRPVLDQTPAAMLSFQVHENAMQEIQREFRPLLRIVGLPEAALNHLGPTVHIALEDDISVLEWAMSLDGGAGNGFISQADLLMSLPLLSTFTRATTLAWEVKNEEALLRNLRGMGAGNLSGTDAWLRWHVTPIAEEDRWIVTLKIIDTLELRLGVEIDDGWLLVGNLPLHKRPKVRETEIAGALTAGISLFPAQLDASRPLHNLRAIERDHTAAMRATGLHLLLRLAGFETREAAETHLQHAFGLTPALPDGDAWAADAQPPRSQTHGSSQRPRFPDPATATPAALFPGVHTLHAFMQFEQDGLRTRIQWKLEDE